MSTPKRHHYVPQVLLKRFVDQGGWLHTFSKDDPERKIRKERPCNVFVQKHLYSTEERDGVRDPALEREFARLEGIVDPILDKFELAAAQDTLPRLSPNERLAWHYFFALQFKRVPDLLHRPKFVEDAAAFFRQTLNEFRQRFPHRREEIDEIEKEEPRFIKNAQVGALTSISADVIDVLESRGIALLKLLDPKKSFAIGSRPVVQLAFTSERTLRQPPTEVWLPISSRVLVGVGHSGHPESLLSLGDHAAVRALNLAAAEQSSQIASCSPELTKSLAFAR